MRGERKIQLFGLLGLTLLAAPALAQFEGKGARELLSIPARMRQKRKAGPQMTPGPDWNFRRFLKGDLGQKLKSFHSKAELRALYQSDGELAIFDKLVRPTLPPLPSDVAGWIQALQAHFPKLNPATFFVVPRGHFLDRDRAGAEKFEGGGDAYNLIDGKGGAEVYALLQIRSKLLIRNVDIILHEHRHQAQPHSYAFARRLSQETGIPVDFLNKICSRLMEGEAQYWTYLQLRGLILKRDALAQALRQSINQEFRGKNGDYLLADYQPKSEQEARRYQALREGKEELCDSEPRLLYAIERREIYADNYASYAITIRDFPRSPGEGSPVDDIVLRGDISKLTRAWSAERRQAVELLAQQARRLENLKNVTLNNNLEEHIERAMDPTSDYRLEHAKALINSHRNGYPSQEGLPYKGESRPP